MRISLSLDKSVEENAGIYFDKAKKAKKKLEGARKALLQSQADLKALEKKMLEKKKAVEEKEAKVERKKEWYEKFRWFYTSDGFLVIAGRDATTNEIIIKKHTQEEDMVFHTDMAGSPFAVIKSDGKKIGAAAIDETAQFTACYAKAWQLGLSRADVFHVEPSQVSKTAPPGEFIQKGSFMIYGKKNNMSTNLVLYIGMLDDGRIMSGPEAAVKAKSAKFVQIVPGKEKTSDLAKSIRAKIGGELDEIIKVIPGGGAKLAK